MKKEYQACYISPIGSLQISGTEKAITSLRFEEKKCKSDPALPVPLQDCLLQLDEYFKGKRKRFTVKLRPQGTEFQKKVWNQLMSIPYAKTLSYKDVAQAIGDERAVRAVGGANGRNPIGILIPCHRVISHDGTLGGFGGGLWRKKWLLNHEKKFGGL
jgi:methylated-DNA-[protein]-cysteine S-methyltransferase